tara:strand:- start:560 stop:889 length:330 start_codon:yes stop_codon:yes gene_type:complete
MAANDIDPTRVYAHLAALYKECLIIHEASGNALVETINALSRKAEADKEFLDAFQHLVPRQVSEAPPPLPGKDQDWRDDHMRRLNEALGREAAYDDEPVGVDGIPGGMR